MQKKEALPDPLEKDPRGEFDGRYDVTDRQAWPGAVLLADEIRYYCENPDSPMIAPFKLEDLRAASYSLRLGTEIHVGGRTEHFRDGKVVLEPHQVAVVSTLETLNIPRFLIARWSLRVRKIYEGLLWTGGLQVDPGWRGRLFCPVYNLSDEEVELRFEDKFFTMDFIRTTALTDEYYAIVRDYPKTRYPSAEEDPHIDDYDTRRIHSAPYERLRNLESVEDEVRQLRTTILSGFGILFAAIGAVVAGLTIFAATAQFTPARDGSLGPAWFGLSLAASIGAFLLACYACYRLYSLTEKLAADDSSTGADSPQRKALPGTAVIVSLVGALALVLVFAWSPWDSGAETLPSSTSTPVATTAPTAASTSTPAVTPEP